MQKGDRVYINAPDHECHGWGCIVEKVGETICRVWVHNIAANRVVATIHLTHEDPTYYTLEGNVYKPSDGYLPMTVENAAQATERVNRRRAQEAQVVEDDERFAGVDGEALLYRLAANVKGVAK